MSHTNFSAARDELAACLRTLEASERALGRVLTGECEAELRAYAADVRRTRLRCEALERLLLAEITARERSR